MNKLNRSFIYKKLKNTLVKKYGKEKTNLIWNDAGLELKKSLKEYKTISKDEKMMILPLAAIYNSLRKNNVNDSIDMLIEYGKQTGLRMKKIILRITSIPGLSKILWKNMPKLMRKTSSPKKGYERKIVSETNELVGVDILVCPLYKMAKKLNVPEIAPVICAMDKEYMTGFKKIEYTRSKAIGNGDDCCDYRLRYNKGKKD